MKGSEVAAAMESLASAIRLREFVSPQDAVDALALVLGVRSEYEPDDFSGLEAPSAAALRAKKYRLNKKRRVESGAIVTQFVTPKRDGRHAESVTRVTPVTPSVTVAVTGAERSEGGSGSDAGDAETSEKAADSENSGPANSSPVSGGERGPSVTPVTDRHAESVTRVTPVTRDASRSPSRARAWRRVPSDWVVKDSHRTLALGLLVDVEFEAQAFRDHEFARPRSDPDATFNNWIRTAATRSRPFPTRTNGNRGPMQPSHGMTGLEGAKVIR